MVMFSAKTKNPLGLCNRKTAERGTALLRLLSTNNLPVDSKVKSNPYADQERAVSTTIKSSKRLFALPKASRSLGLLAKSFKEGIAVGENP